MSQIPCAPDVLGADVPVIPLPDVAARLGLPVTKVHQMLRDGDLVALRRNGVMAVPTAFLVGSEPDAVVKALGGTLTVLRDSGFSEEEIIRWLFADDDSLPGTPIDALRGNRGREVKRRAQAMAF